MKKKKINVFNRNAYLLGMDNEGIKYYLEEAKFDCGWYWGIGYVETYTNNRNPEKSKDISSHTHFNSLIFDEGNSFDTFEKLFIDNPFNNSEIWKILEIMKSLYTLRDYSDFIHRGGSNYTNNPLKEDIKNESEYNRINKIIIPSLLEKLYNILYEQ